MRRHACLTSTLACLALCAFLTPSSARAGRTDFPNPANSTIPAFVTLVGHRGGVPDPSGEFVVVFRDIANDPIPGARITCDFSDCRDLRLAAQQPYPGLHVDCTYRIVWTTTDATGTAHFCIVGGANNPGAASGAGFQKMRIYADGILLGSVSASALDQNGYDGVHANDLSAWIADVLAGLQVQRSDYDGNELLGANDASVWIARFLAAGSIEGAASLPGGLCP